MKLALIGVGKMGRMIETAAVRQGHEIIQKFWDVRPLKADAETRKRLKGVDVLIDFSTADSVADNVRAAADLSLSMVEGTTGWQGRLQEVECIVRESGIGFVYASNFSIGVNLFYRVVEKAGEVFSPFKQYDPFIEESHHKFKKDAPSGTAIEIGKLLQPHYPSGPVPVSSVRAGYIPGEHSVGFDSAVDMIRLTHTARSREGLAEGALLASSWISGKTGCFRFSDVLDQILSEKTK
jgi:4-hydroxy-tetrahydrodipicolinate reductase